MKTLLTVHALTLLLEDAHKPCNVSTECMTHRERRAQWSLRGEESPLAAINTRISEAAQDPPAPPPRPRSPRPQRRSARLMAEPDPTSCFE